MSDMLRNNTEEDPYQRRSVVRFHDTLDVVMEGSSTNNDYYEDAIDIESPLVRQNDTTLHDSSSLVGEMEDVELAASSDEDDDDDDDHDNEEKTANGNAIDDNQKDDSSHSSGPPPGDTVVDWLSYLYRSYSFVTLLMASGGAMLTSVISFLCPSNQNNKQIDEDDLMAITSMANGDKAFLFVGGDGGSSFISYVNASV